MLVLLVMVVKSGLPVPPECEQPELRDVLQLKQLAQLDGALSVGLDSVATWCFDPGGSWTGGELPKPGKGKVKAVKEAPAVGDCAKAIASCEASRTAADKPALRALASTALVDLERPFRNSRYVPKRSGLRDQPNTKADCLSRERSELFAQAQARMDVARLTSQIQSEYSNYKAWLMKESLTCRGEVATAKRGAKDNTRVSVEQSKGSESTASAAVSSDSASTAAASSSEAAKPATGQSPLPTLGTPLSSTTVEQPGPTRPSKGKGTAPAAAVAESSVTKGAAASGSSEPAVAKATVPPAAPNAGAGRGLGPGDAGAEPPLASWVMERETALNKPMLEKWKYLAELTAKQETDRDYTLGFLVSRELRGCDCTRVNPAAIVRSLEKKEGGQQGLALLQAEDGVNTRCTVCALDAFGAWKPRAEKLCRQMDQFTDFELEKLAQSDDANGLPPRCLDETRARRAEAKAAEEARRREEEAARARPSVGAGTQLPSPLPSRGDGGAWAASSPAPDGGAPIAARPSPQPNPNLVTVNGMTYYRPAAAGLDGGPPMNIPPVSSGVSSAGGTAGAADAGAAVVTTPAVGSTLTGPGVAALGNASDSFVPPEAWAPIPPREEGRLYVRLSMSAACVAEISPGPIQARNGDLLLVPFGARALAVKSPCGGLAEIYWGREAKPRFSEVFGRHQPLKFEFKNIER